MVQQSLFSSATPEWETPRSFFEAVDMEFRFALDPCSADDNAKCTQHFTKKDNGLAQDWGDHVVFMNSPYGREISEWMKKAYESARNGVTVACLVPARTDTRWWHQYAMKGEIRLLRGRIRFIGGKHSALVIFRPPGFKIVAAS